MPLDPDFIADCSYGPGGILIDEILEVDREKSFVRMRMPTHANLPITEFQRAHPKRHPRHVSGGLMVHMTGVAGLVHAYYVLDMRHAEGWVGYGGRIHKANFKNLAPPGEPLELSCRATKVQLRRTKAVVRYDLLFTQAGKEIYQGDQTAMWLKIPLDDQETAASQEAAL